MPADPWSSVAERPFSGGFAGVEDMMSINPLQSTSTLNDLASALVSRFDSNKDGQLTTEEFTKFLSTMLGSTGLSTSANTTGATGTTGTSSTTFHGTTRPTMAGFDAGKLADVTHTTMRYKFGRVAQQYSLESVNDKTSAQALLTTMKPDLEAAGLQVLGVDGDSIKVNDNGQETWIDVIRGSKSGSPAWQWLV